LTVSRALWVHSSPEPIAEWTPANPDVDEPFSQRLAASPPAAEPEQSTTAPQEPKKETQNDPTPNTDRAAESRKPVEPEKKCVEEDDSKRSDADDELFRRYAERYVYVNGEIVKVPQSILDRSESFDPKNFRVGQTGSIKSCRVVQIFEDSYLVSVDGRMLYVTGFRTKDLTEGEAIGLPDIGLVTTHKYRTVLGTVKTVPIVMPLSNIDAGLGRARFDKLLEDKKIRTALESELKESLDLEAGRKNLEQLRRKGLQKHLEVVRAEAREKEAKANVEYAKRCIGRDELDKAKKRLNEVIKDYPGTKAVEEAVKLLKELEAKKD
jgi:hypothetical protein